MSEERFSGAQDSGATTAQKAANTGKRNAGRRKAAGKPARTRTRAGSA
ncbi:MAG: hypothetical protein JO168_12960 [Solirubrobacterales bacterium]|nr:hypothetical protein [Solirubrobacterales bacterium]MBV9717155.1 hypothetical protein [Solirubrobacterales bacterium]